VAQIDEACLHGSVDLAPTVEKLIGGSSRFTFEAA
jgi:hypothetical protein